MFVRGQNSGGGGEISVAEYTQFSAVGTSGVQINCDIGDYILVTALRSASGVGVNWNGTAAHLSTDLVTRVTNLATNNIFSMVFKASQTSNVLAMASSGATITGGYSIVKLV